MLLTRCFSYLNRENSGSVKVSFSLVKAFPRKQGWAEN